MVSTDNIGHNGGNKTAEALSFPIIKAHNFHVDLGGENYVCLPLGTIINPPFFLFC